MVNQVKTPPLRLLRAFCLAARHSSFKDAADRLSLTPSAVSHQVKELEEQLGVTLFQRRTRSVALTPTGRQLLEDLEPALEALNEAISRTARAANARRQLHVVMPPFFASELFAPRLQEFSEQHPNIDIQVDTHQPRPMQHPGYSDLSVVLASRAPGNDAEAVRLMPLRLVAVASKKLAAELAGRKGGRAFENQALIVHKHFRTDVWDRWLEQIGLDISRVKNVVEFDNMFAVARAAERGAGIALMPALVCRPWFATGALAEIEGFELRSEDAYYVVARREDVGRAEVLALTRWMIKEFQVPG
jgi:LysR family transcriptional regulator, glycine cleavage system transcriptional activator